MRFNIVHTTRYRYSRPVFLDPHTIRLHPRYSGDQTPIHFELTVTPEPTGMTRCLDAEENVVDRCWWEQMTDELAVTARVEARTLRSNPYDFVLSPAATTLPMSYPGESFTGLEVYRRRATSPYRDEAHDPVARLAHEVADEAGGQTIDFLTALCRQISERTRHTIRETGDPQPPEQTLRDGEGACRDVAVLFSDACRVMGFAARFVSGYQHSPEADGRRHMHAWAEVYLPFAGWRGFDPSHGLAVADHHLALATSFAAAHATPVLGRFRGADVTSQMTADIEMDHEER
mgnify:CR=1 FL=1